jgi:hypothetical protein
MPLPNSPVTLSVQQIAELDRNLSALRHDVNNNLSLIMASVELIRRRPEGAERLLNMLVEQPHKIAESLTRYSRETESVLGISKP